MIMKLDERIEHAAALAEVKSSYIQGKTYSTLIDDRMEISCYDFVVLLDSVRILNEIRMELDARLIAAAEVLNAIIKTEKP